MILVDAGPLVALLDAGDQHHAACVAAFKRIREPLATVWPALSEAMSLFEEQPRAQEALFSLLERNVIDILPLGAVDLPRMRELMKKSADRPMDLVAAALVRVAERERLHKIFTVDRKDFAVYRVHGRARFTLVH